MILVDVRIDNKLGMLDYIDACTIMSEIVSPYLHYVAADLVHSAVRNGLTVTFPDMETVTIVQLLLPSSVTLIPQG